MCYTPDNKYLVSASHDKTIRCACRQPARRGAGFCCFAAACQTALIVLRCCILSMFVLYSVRLNPFFPQYLHPLHAIFKTFCVPTASNQ